MVGDCERDRKSEPRVRVEERKIDKEGEKRETKGEEESGVGQKLGHLPENRKGHGIGIGRS